MSSILSFSRFLILFWESHLIGSHACKVRKCISFIKICIWFHTIFQWFLNNLFKAILRFAFTKPILSVSLLCSDWSDGPVCCDWSIVYGACWKGCAYCHSSVFWMLDRKYKHLLFIILTGFDWVEPAGPNKLGTEPSIRSKCLVNPTLNSPILEKQSSVKWQEHKKDWVVLLW